MILKHPPSDRELERVYFELATMGAKCVGESHRWSYKGLTKETLIALAAEMSRYDPRLFGILVEFFATHWQTINPTTLRATYRLMKTPQIFGVIMEFIKSYSRNIENHLYASYLTKRLKPVPLQLFFHNIYTIGGHLVKRATETSLAEFKKWGFLAAERPTIEQHNKVTIGSLDPSSRKNILKNLLNKNHIITMTDYLKALHHSISRQQALLDLKASKLVKKIGTGRGARWKCK